MNICDPFQSCEARSLVDGHTQWQAWGSEAGVLIAQLFIYLILVFVDFNVIKLQFKIHRVPSLAERVKHGYLARMAILG